MQSHILIVDDEKDVRDSLARLLTITDEVTGEIHYRVSAVTNGQEMRQVIQQDKVDLIVMDLILLGSNGRPLDEDGLALTKWLRERTNVSILVYSVKAEEVDEISALDMGADEYIRKPSTPEIIKARTRALLRRRDQHVDHYKNYLLNKGKVVLFGGWRFEVGSRVVTSTDGEARSLSYSEHDFLAMLVNSESGESTREELNAFVLGRDADKTDRRLDNLVNRLRHKLGDRMLFRAVRGGGYRLTVPVEIVQSKDQSNIEQRLQTEIANQS